MPKMPIEALREGVAIVVPNVTVYVFDQARKEEKTVKMPVLKVGSGCRAVGMERAARVQWMRRSERRGAEIRIGR